MAGGLQQPEGLHWAPRESRGKGDREEGGEEVGCGGGNRSTREGGVGGAKEGTGREGGKQVDPQQGGGGGGGEGEGGRRGGKEESRERKGGGHSASSTRLGDLDGAGGAAPHPAGVRELEALVLRLPKNVAVLRHLHLELLPLAAPKAGGSCHPLSKQQRTALPFFLSWTPPPSPRMGPKQNERRVPGHGCRSLQCARGSQCPLRAAPHPSPSLHGLPCAPRAPPAPQQPMGNEN